MANVFNAQVRITPHFSEPELILTITQPSGAFMLFEGGAPRVKISNTDLFVYVNHLDIRTDAQASQFPSNELPSSTLVGEYFSTMTYLIRSRAIYGRASDTAAAGYNVSVPNAQKLGMRQAIVQQMRTAALYGINGSNGEGLLNASGATSVTLPPDPYGNTTVSTYDNGAMVTFILQQLVTIMNAMFQTGAVDGGKIRIVGPQRIFNKFQISEIIQVTSFQRPGGGTATVGQAISQVAEEAGWDMEYGYDDTLIGKGSGGTDMVIITIPELTIPDQPGISTAPFNEMMPSTKAVNVMYADQPAPIQIPTPIPDGEITEVSELRITSGWNWRPQGLILCSMQYS
jgi:hypothetical protein